MKPASKAHVRELLSRRQDFLQLVLVAALLAAGVNLVAAYVSSLRILGVYTVLLGAAIIVAALLWLVLLTFRERTASASLDAAFLFDSKEKRLLTIPDYWFSVELGRAVHAVLAENKAIFQMWQKEPLAKYRPRADSREPSAADDTLEPAPKLIYAHLVKITRDDGAQPQEPQSRILIREAAEYLLIEALSGHLSAYFGNEQEEDSYVRKYQSRDIPHLLLENRVLALLSSPLRDRPAFVDRADAEKPGEEVLMAWSGDGELYHRFELFLPRETLITRTKSGDLQLDNRRLRITLSASYLGFVSNVPSSEFSALVLRRDPWQIEEFKVVITLTYSVKPLALFRRTGWRYYEWLDSFATDLAQRVSIDDYLHRIMWPSLSILARILRSDAPEDDG